MEGYLPRWLLAAGAYYGCRYVGSEPLDFGWAEAVLDKD